MELSANNYIHTTLGLLSISELLKFKAKNYKVWNGEDFVYCSGFEETEAVPIYRIGLSNGSFIECGLKQDWIAHSIPAQTMTSIHKRADENAQDRYVTTEDLAPDMVVQGLGLFDPYNYDVDGLDINYPSIEIHESIQNFNRLPENILMWSWVDRACGFLFILKTFGKIVSKNKNYHYTVSINDKELFDDIRMLILSLNIFPYYNHEQQVFQPTAHSIHTLVTRAIDVKKYDRHYWDAQFQKLKPLKYKRNKSPRGTVISYIALTDRIELVYNCIVSQTNKLGLLNSVLMVC